VATVPGDHHPGGSRARERAGLDGLTPAQAHALSRSAPLTPAQFKQHRRHVEQRSAPLPVLLDDASGRYAARHRGAPA
jgi:hypothetical protein